MFNKKRMPRSREAWAPRLHMEDTALCVHLVELELRPGGGRTASPRIAGRRNIERGTVQEA